MKRRELSRAFKQEAMKLVGEPGVAVVQTARDLDLHDNVLRKSVREAATDPPSASWQAGRGEQS